MVDVVTRTTTDADRAWATVEFRAMGSRCHVVAPDRQLALEGRALVERLERSWTRFRPESELSRANAAAGRVCLISRELHAVLAAARRAHTLSGGRFDVRCLSAVEYEGYDSSWEVLATAVSIPPRPDPPPRPLSTSTEPFVLFADPPALLVPSGHRLDLGGIGKGCAADLVVDHLRGLGADRVQVDLGGDVRVAGRPWGSTSWCVEVEDPLDPTRTVAVLELDEGAVATSSVLRRRWRRGDTVVHHLVDVRTMRSAETDLVAVTAIATELWAAEVAAKCALIAGRDGAAAALAPFGARALLFDGSGGPPQEVAP